MLAAVLPGIREVRTPLIVGWTWFACFWILLGHRTLQGENTAEFISGYSIDTVPNTFWFATISFASYLIGSLLTIERSPFKWVLSWAENRLFTDSLDMLKRIPGLYMALMGPLKEGASGILNTQFDDYYNRGFVPVLLHYGLPSGAKKGLYRLDDAEEYGDVPAVTETLSELRGQYQQEVIGDREAIELRIQLRHPDLFADIDRLKSEASLRYSLFWPLIILIVALSCTWSPWFVLVLIVPIALMFTGRHRNILAGEKTWGAMEAGEVTSPTIDDVEEMARTATIKDLPSIHSIVTEPSD